MSNEINDIEISCQGINMLIDNDWEGCEKLYTKYKDTSPLLNYCFSFMSFTRAVMTFEEPLLEKAQKDIDATEKLCSTQTKKFSTFKKAFGISSSSSSNQLSNQQNASNSLAESIEDKYTKAIILADCKLYSAILTFVRQEASAYLTNGVLQIRKSWKMYAKIQRQLYDIYKKLEPNAEQIYGSDPNSAMIQLFVEETETDDTTAAATTEDTKAKQSQMDQALNELNLGDNDTDTDNAAINEPVLTLEVCKRLLGAVSFGYGLFQICLSFIPPNMLKLVKLIGFEVDRMVAIKAINFTSNSKDMRAPFADLVLLWYSAIATPLFAITEADGVINEEDTRLILEKNLAKYTKSSLFLYMKGKYCRTLLNDCAASLACFEQASENSKHIREIQFISIYEIGWLYLQPLEYDKAYKHFEVLHKESRWSKSFNTYICAILQGAMGHYDQANKLIKEAIKTVQAQTRKPNPIEMFSLKRTEYFKKNPIVDKHVCELLIIELMYLWVCFPYCEEKYLRRMLEMCDKITDKYLVPIKCLFEGSIYMTLKNKEFGEQCFNESIARAESIKKPPFGKYVLPCANLELATFFTDEKDFTQAKSFLNKSRIDKEYELDNRIHAKIKSLEKRIKFLVDGPRIAANLKAKSEMEQEEKTQKEKNANNFFVN